MPYCDHTMTVGGVTFWIGATSEDAAVVGALVLASGLVIFLYGVLSSGTHTPK
ncbi:MAG: hypothetical protein ABSG45_07450 [Nitrososphaerales archaeon]